MKNRFRGSVQALIISCILILFVASAQARAAQSGLASWSGVFINGKFGDGPWGYFLESQTRLQQNVNTQRGNKFMLRAAVRYALDRRFRAYVGYAWTPNFSPFRNENRVFEQFSYSETFGDWLIGLRARLEQRRIEYTNDRVAHRLRGQVRFNYYVDSEHRFAAVFSDEWFMNLNDVPNGPQSGFDQNRIFVGPCVTASKDARIEFGYLNARVNSSSILTDDLISHAIVTYVYLDF